MIHGLDVARGILAVHNQFSLAAGLRWVVTDGRVYVLCTIISYQQTSLPLDMTGGTWPALGELVAKRTVTRCLLDCSHR